MSFNQFFIRFQTDSPTHHPSNNIKTPTKNETRVNAILQSNKLIASPSPDPYLSSSLSTTTTTHILKNNNSTNGNSTSATSRKGKLQCMYVKFEISPFLWHKCVKNIFSTLTFNEKVSKKKEIENSLSLSNVSNNYYMYAKRSRKKSIYIIKYWTKRNNLSQHKQFSSGELVYLLVCFQWAQEPWVGGKRKLLSTSKKYIFADFSMSIARSLLIDSVLHQ